MISAIRQFFLIAAILVVTGCAGPVRKIDTSPGALADVKTVAVIRAPEPKTYTVMNFGHPGIAFGLVGGLVAAADQSSKQERLTKAIKEKAPAQTADALAEGIAGQLQRRGFDARVEDGPWEENDGKFKLEFDKITSSADAVLVVTPTMVGFIATGVTSDYLPTVTAIITLLGKDRKEQLYRGFHAAGWQPKAEGWRYSPPTETFGNFDALMADPTKTGLALAGAAREIASTVADDLKR
ncbi:hypothetical protein [Azoarcus sp. KH32C]|uniref:hypothetical protein n=1 Tax=Azoarcus sp. KH32C TaxID=748247 RepID=UPI0002385C10|nr:hypothetical protein [Azoarcus sp. KH32C]BAL26843.1 hypothetical protein AZKH_4570 [Azoarcus sp. KH32C]